MTSIPEFCHHTGYNRFMSDQYDDIDKKVHRILFHFECSPIFPNYKMIHIAHHIRYIKGEFHKDREWYSKLMSHIIDNSLAWNQISQEKYTMLKETLSEYLCTSITTNKFNQ